MAFRKWNLGTLKTMKPKRTLSRLLKILIDTAMYAGMLYLMSYRPGRGLFAHGTAGCAVFALFVLHHLLNIGWYTGFRRGSWNTARRLFVGTNTLLTMSMLLLAASSVMLSGEVFAVLPFLPAGQGARTLHTVSAAWCFVFTVLHIGLHTHAPLLRLRKKAAGTKAVFLLYAAYGLFGAAGLGSFVLSGLWRSLFALPGAAPYVSDAAFYALYVLMTAAGAISVHAALSVLNCQRSPVSTA